MKFTNDLCRNLISITQNTISFMSINIVQSTSFNGQFCGNKSKLSKDILILDQTSNCVNYGSNSLKTDFQFESRPFSIQSIMSSPIPWAFNLSRGDRG